MAQLSKENTLQREAFDIYYMLGDRRSLKAVADRIGRTERTVAGWSRTFSWVDRVKQREIEEEKAVGGGINSHTTDVKVRYRILMNNLLAKASEKIAKGELCIRNIQDLERVVKLDLLLMGESTENSSSTATTELSVADKQRLDDIAKLLSGK